MAAALGAVMRMPQGFDPVALRARVLPRFGAVATGQRLFRLYERARSGRASRRRGSCL
jgi:hypothetical protein